MKNRLLPLLLCLALASLCAAQGAQPAGNAEGLSPGQIERIDAVVRGWMAQHKAPALSVAVVLNDRMTFSKGYGLADVENNVAARADTVYRLASISKSLTAVAVMQLVERGKIDPGAPVSRYCPAYPEKQALKGAPDKQFSVTVRQLIVHQSGVRHNKPEEVLGTKHYGSINEAVGSFKDDPLVVEPESVYSYSTPGYTLLGCAVEGASGQPYMDYLREQVLKPAGMTRTFADDVYAIIPNRARGYRKTQAGEVQNAPLHDTSIKVPGGGLVTTTEDIARFAVAVNTHRLVKAETLAQMWVKPKARDGKEQGYAMGFLIDDRNNLLRVSNDGAQAGTRTYLFMVPKQKFALALATNLERAWCEELTPKIIEALNGK